MDLKKIGKYIFGLLIIPFLLFSNFAVNIPFVSTSLILRISYTLNTFFIIGGIFLLVKKSLKFNYVLVLFVLYLFFSAWGINKYNNTHELTNISIDLLVYTVIGIIAGQLLEFEKGVKLLFNYFILLDLLCLAIANLFPSTGIESTGEWKGIFNQKNALAYVMVFELVVNYTYLLINLKYKKYKKTLLCILLIFINYFILFKTQSATGILVGFVILVLYITFVILRRISNVNLKISISFLLILILFSSIIFIINFKESLFLILGKDDTLTGRNVIYNYAISIIKNHLFFGIGYSGVPNSFLLNSSKAYNSLGLNVYYSHNGLLEILIQTGIFGLLIYMYFYYCIFKSLYFIKDNNIVVFFIVSFFLYNIIYNISEVTFFTGEGNNFHWLIMCSLISYYFKFRQNKKHMLS